MKILYFFQELDTPMFQWQRKHFLDELSHHGIEIETFNPLLYSNTDEANEQLIVKAKASDYDLFISNMGYFKMLYAETLITIKKIGIPTLRIAWDNLMIPFIDKELAPHFDLVWLTAKETKRLYDKWHVHTMFAPYAANPFTYTYNSDIPIQRNACFIGNPHGSRAIMINKLTENGLIVNLYNGRNKTNVQHDNKIPIKCSIINPSRYETILNRFRFTEGRKLILGSVYNKLKGQTIVASNDCLNHFPGASHDEMTKIYSSSVLSLASSSAGHTDVLKNPLKIINLRNFEIPMCGGIQICKYNEELASYFEEGKEIVLYHTDDELVDKSRYYINKATEEGIRQMKEAARKRAEKEHTWWCRFTKAFDILGLKYKI